MEVDKDGTYDARPMWTAMFIPGPEEDKQLQTEKQTADPCDPLRDLKPHGLAFCCLNTSSIFLSESPSQISLSRVFRPPTKMSPTQRRLSRPICKNTEFLIIISASSFNIFKTPSSKIVIHSYVCRPPPLPLQCELPDHGDLPGPFRLTTLHPQNNTWHGRTVSKHLVSRF